MSEEVTSNEPVVKEVAEQKSWSDIGVIGSLGFAGSAIAAPLVAFASANPILSGVMLWFAGSVGAAAVFLGVSKLSDYISGNDYESLKEKAKIDREEAEKTSVERAKQMEEERLQKLTAMRDEQEKKQRDRENTFLNREL